jgi:hypothetical protein
MGTVPKAQRWRRRRAGAPAPVNIAAVRSIVRSVVSPHRRLSIASTRRWMRTTTTMCWGPFGGCATTLAASCSPVRVWPRKGFVADNRWPLAGSFHPVSDDLWDAGCFVAPDVRASFGFFAFSLCVRHSLNHATDRPAAAAVHRGLPGRPARDAAAAFGRCKRDWPRPRCRTDAARVGRHRRYACFGWSFLSLR